MSKEEEYIKPEIKVYRPLKAIKVHCMDCAGESFNEVIGCQILDCALWPWRLGVRPTSSVYQRRVKKFFERGGEIVDEVHGLGLDMADYLKMTGKTSRPGVKKTLNKNLVERGDNEKKTPY
jgi:hypothetical protein